MPRRRPVVGGCTCRLVVVPVERIRERHPVATILQRESPLAKEPVAEPADPGARVRQLRRGVLDDALGRVVVAGSADAAAGPEECAALRVLQAGIGARLLVRAAEIGAELRPGTVECRIAVAFVRRDHVDEAADGVRSVQQRCRTAHDLDPLGAVRVDRDTVITGLARQVTRADPILENQHPVAVEAADDWPARTGAEAAARNTRLVLQRFPQAAARLPHQIERVERRYRIERLERRFGAARHGSDRYVLVHGRQSELEIDGCRPAWGHGNHLPPSGKMLPLGEDFV